MEALGDPEVIPLWFGESDIPTPSFIRDAAKAALDRGETFYSYSRGTPALRAAIEAYLSRLYGTAVHPDRISVAGSTMLSTAEQKSATGRSKSRPVQVCRCRVARGGQSAALSR
jgi:aspartate/methionine/tyrosine aminotransferase